MTSCSIKTTLTIGEARTRDTEEGTCRRT